ncbi:MAG: hypothetical protein OCD01_02830 [Fibrobacterales bacterium]
MNIHLDYHDPIRPPKAHRVDAPEAATTHSEVEKHLIDNEEHKKNQQQSGQQQQHSKQDSVEAKLLASIQETLKKPIFAGNLSTQSIETLGTIFEKLHDLESNVKIREQIRQLLQELANSSIDELNLLEKKIKLLISNELLRVVPANSTLHQADKMAIRLLNHLSVNDFSAAREATTLLHSFLKSPSSATYTPTTKFGNTVVQQLLDATAFSNQKLNLPQVSDVANEFKQRLATPITEKQAQLLSTQIQKTQSPFLLGHVVSHDKGSTSIVVEGQQLTLPKELGLNPGESFLFELVDKKGSQNSQTPAQQGIYIHPATTEASPQTLKLFSKTTTPIDQLLRLYSTKNKPQQAELEIDKLLKSAQSTPPSGKDSSQLVTSELMRHSPKAPPFLQQVSPTPRVIETIGFLNQYQELFQKAAPQTVQAVSNLFYTAETMLSHGETLKPAQEELLFKLLLANNLELPSPKEIERVLQYDGFKSTDRNLVPPNNTQLIQQLQGTFPDKPLSAFDTLSLLQSLHENSDTMRESSVLRTLIDHVQTNLFEQQTQEQNNQQNLYWMHNQNLHKGRITVKDDREKDQSGAPKEGPIGFVLETQTPNLGDVSINFHLDSDNVDIMMLDSHGTHGSIVDSERADLAKEFQTFGWNLEQLRYGLLAGKDRAAEPPSPPQKPVGWDGIDLKA